MYAGIAAQLWMKRYGHGVSLADHHRIAAFGSQNFYTATHAGDLRRPNEHHLDGRTAKKTCANRTINLASVGVAPDADVERAKSGLLRVFYLVREQDSAGTGTERRLHAHEFFQLFEPGFAEKFKEGAGFATWYDQPVDFLELLGFLNEHDCGAELFEPPAVSIEVPLQGEDADSYIGS